MKKNKENSIAQNIKNNPKAFYQYIASKSVKKEGVANLINSDGKLTNNDKEKCDILNNFFNSVYTIEDTSNIPNFDHYSNSLPKLESCKISLHEMEIALFNLNENKSPGPDNLYPKLLKSCSKTLAKPLKILFDSTLVNGCIPNEWKRAEVRPIFKKGDKSNPGNYRPVSLTSVVCKIMEKFIKNSLN